jgi:hypothetical protein
VAKRLPLGIVPLLTGGKWEGGGVCESLDKSGGGRGDFDTATLEGT